MPSIATITVTYMSKDVFNAPLKSYKQLLAILPTNSNFSCLPVFLMSFLLLFCFCIPEIPVLEWCTVFFRDQPIPFITRAHFKNDVLQHLRRSIIKAWKIPISINTKVCPALFIAIVAWLKWLGEEIHSRIRRFTRIWQGPRRERFCCGPLLSSKILVFENWATKHSCFYANSPMAIRAVKKHSQFGLAAVLGSSPFQKPKDDSMPSIYTD